MARRKRRWKRAEWSKKFAGIVAFSFGVFAIWATVRYFELTEMAIVNQSAIVPDATLPVAYVTTVIAALLSYLLYQAGLKNSRNKYGIDADGQPFKLEPPDDGTAG